MGCTELISQCQSATGSQFVDLTLVELRIASHLRKMHEANKVTHFHRFAEHGFEFFSFNTLASVAVFSERDSFIGRFFSHFCNF